MLWEVTLNFVSPAWTAYGRLVMVDAVSEAAARRMALRIMVARTRDIIVQHEDYFIGPLKFRVTSAVRVSRERADEIPAEASA